MHRRNYLALAGSALIAGCTSGSDTGSSDTSSSSSSESSTKSSTSSSSSSGGGKSSTEAQSSTANTTTQAKQSASVEVGEVVKGSSMAMVVTDFETKEKLDEYDQADSGKTYAVVSLAVKNKTSKKFMNFSSLLQAQLKDSRDYSYEEAITGADNSFSGGELAPGELTRGNLYYQVPKDAKGLKLLFDFSSVSFLDFERVTIDLEQEASSASDLKQDLHVELHKVGESVTQDKLKVTLNSVDTKTKLGQYTKADDGNEYVILDISTTNNTGDELSISTMLQMALKDGEGHSYFSDVGTASLDQSYKQGSPLGDGETRRGKLAYQVEKGKSPLYWTFDFDTMTDGDKTFWKVR